jgi:FMN phosphatase YigB (HAD superfamily)
MSEMQALVFDLCRTLCFSPTPERKRELKLQYYIAILPKLAPVLSEAFPEIGQLTPETLLEQMTNVEARIFSLDIVDE